MSIQVIPVIKDVARSDMYAYKRYVQIQKFTENNSKDVTATHSEIIIPRAV